MTEPSLLTIGINSGTDKVEHGYLPHYETHLGELRHLPIDLLEIGVWKGDSLRMWEDFFRNACIVGVDIDPKNVVTTDRIRTIIGDIKTVGLPDTYNVIIDDGSHLPDDIVVAWERLWDHVRPGGWYIIEDWWTQWQGRWGGGVTGSKATALADLLVHDLLGEMPTSVEEIHVYTQLLFIKKKP